MSYKRLIPCIFIKDGKAVRWIDDPTVVSKDVIELAKYYSDHGANASPLISLNRFGGVPSMVGRASPLVPS